jgi:hypothetical protein
VAPSSRIVALALTLSALAPAAAEEAGPRRLRIVFEDAEAIEVAEASRPAGRIEPVDRVAAIESRSLPVAEVEPAPPPDDWIADALRTPVEAGEGFRIQVGAFGEAGRAEARIAELETLAAGPGADPIRRIEPAGALFRAQMSGFVDRDAADGACARIEAAGAECFVVAP